MKPKLIHNWPNVQKEQDEVSYIINKVMDGFNQEKEAEADFRKKLSNDQLDNRDSDSPRHMSRDEIKFRRDSTDVYKERMLNKD